MKRLSAAILGGAMGLSACTETVQREPCTARQQPSAESETTPPEPSKVETPRPEPDMSPMSQMDQAVICFSTQVSAQAFIDAQKAIPTTKGCGVIRALHFQGQRVLDACSPLGDASREWSPEIAGKIEQTRKELRRIETLMQRIKDLNSHCFGGEEPEKKPRKKRQRDKDRDINYPQDDYRRALPA